MLKIDLIPALNDNYCPLLQCTETGTVAVIDPAADDPVESALRSRGLKLDLILNTHHHFDHIDGNSALVDRYGATLIGPASETARIPDMDQTVSEGDEIAVGAAKATVIEVPGHTTGHIAFHFSDDQALFAGDALFALGCGRMFEGTAPEMWKGLLKLRALPDSTLLYCGHEYTASNARYALHVDPNNPALQAYAADIEVLRKAGEPTVPSELGREKKTNPFLRADDPGFAASLGLEGQSAEAVFAHLRRGKDTF